MNTIIISGRMVKDPESIKTKSETSMVKFSLAVDNGFGDKKETFFFNCTTFSKTAENIQKFFKKGDPIAVMGKLTQEKWEKDGKKMSAVSIIVSSFDFMGRAKDKIESQQTDIESAAEMVKEQFQGTEVHGKPFSDDEIPF